MIIPARTGRAAAGLILAAAASALPAAAVGADPPSPRTLLKDASAALAAKRGPEALSAFEAAIAAGAKGERRQEALYWAALLRLTPDPALGDATRGRRWLEELEASGAPETRLRPVRLVAWLLSSLEASRQAAVVTATAAEVQEKESCEEREKALCDARVAAVEADAQKARGEVEACRARTTTVEAELKKTTEALERVREVLLGWTPKP